jgi:hypothetical protein
MISMATTTGLLEPITVAGGNPDEILQGFELDRSVFAKPEGFIPCSVFAGILREAARSTADDCFGLHFAERFNPKNLGPLVYVALNSPTIGAGIQNVGRYLHVYDSSAEWFFTVEADRGYIRFVMTGLGTEPPRQSNERRMTIIVNTLRMMVGSQWAPLEVQFSHEAPEHTSEHHRIFRAPVLFGCETNALVIERNFAEREVPAADRQLYLIIRQYLDQVLSEIPRKIVFLPRFEKRSQKRCAMVVRSLRGWRRSWPSARAHSNGDSGNMGSISRNWWRTHGNALPSLISKIGKTLLQKSLFCSATRSSAPLTGRSNAGPA